MTIVDNKARFGGGILNGSGLINTVVARNAGGNCRGTVLSAGNNLDSDGTCQFAAPTDLSGVAPRIGPLADNGGPTRTHGLAASSPAVDAGDAANCPGSDQRGMPRPVDGDADGTADCDMGSFEYQGGPQTLGRRADPDRRFAGRPAQLLFERPATSLSR